jgi:hypothetical protein
MDVEIGEVSSTLRTVDSDLPLSPQTLQRLVQMVVRAVREGHEHERRVQAERRITGGVSAERDAGEYGP